MIRAQMIGTIKLNASFFGLPILPKQPFGFPESAKTNLKRKSTRKSKRVETKSCFETRRRVLEISRKGKMEKFSVVFDAGADKKTQKSSDSSEFQNRMRMFLPHVEPRRGCD